MDKIKAGIVGIGNMGFAHLNCIMAGCAGKMSVSSVCDINEEKLKAAKERYPDLNIYTSYYEFLENADIDAVIIAVPHRLHCDFAAEAFLRGFNVLVEKPLDVRVSKAIKIIDIARKSGKVFGIMLNQRTNKLFQKAREIVAGGELGELKRSVWIITNWYRTQHYYDSGDWRATWAGEGGGVLLNQAPHNLDLWQWICGMPVSVTAFCDIAKYHNIEVEDDAAIFARYKNGATGMFITSTGEFPGTNRLEVSGERGKIVLEQGRLKWWRLKTCERDLRFSSNVSFPEIESEYEEITMTSPETAHAGILADFAEAVLAGDNGRYLLAPGYDGINSLIISNAAYLSSWKGNREVNIPFDSDSMNEFENKLDEMALKSSFKESSGADGISSGYSKRWQVNW